MEAAAVPATTVAITTGGNGRATAMVAMRGRFDVVLETTGKGPTATDQIAIL